jgi:hypothetical protein
MKANERLKAALKGFLGQVNAVNILLFAGVVCILVFLAYPRTYSGIQIPAPAVSPAEQAKGEPSAQPAAPSVQEYALIAEKNLFHPKRIIPPKKTEETVPRPEFVLYGTLIIDNLKIAYLTDGRAPRSTPGRGGRQTALKLGESMSGYRLHDVMPDRVVMVRGDDRMEVRVISPGGKKNRGSEPAKAAAPASKSSASKPSAHRPSRPSVSGNRIPEAPRGPATPPASRRIRNPIEGRR